MSLIYNNDDKETLVVKTATGEHLPQNFVIATVLASGPDYRKCNIASTERYFNSAEHF